MKKLIIYLTLFLFLGGIYFLAQNQKEKVDKEISGHTVLVKGRIGHVFFNKVNFNLKYSFEVSGKLYDGSDLLPNEYRNCFSTKECIGGTIIIEYSSKNPNRNRIKSNQNSLQ